MDFKMNGLMALVTASSAGIGLEIARSLAKEGVKVIVNGRTESSVNKAIASIKKENPSAQLLPLTATLSTRKGCDLAIEIYPKVDVLVNCLGIYEAIGFFDETDESWQSLFEANVMSGVRLSRYYLQKMLTKNAGRVIFVSSESAISPAPEMTHYSATKTMQLGLSRSLAELTKGTEVTVNSILPGPTRTKNVLEFVKNVFPDTPKEEVEEKFMKENRSSSLIQRFIKPEEIGDIITFLCSNKAAVINGASIRADGGLIKTIF